MLLIFCEHCSFERFVFCNFIFIFVLCGSAKKHVHGEVNEENAEANVLHVLTEQYLEMKNYKYSFNPKFHHILADGTSVFFVFFFVLCWYILFILSFGCVTIVNREMKKCQCYLIYDKAYGYVARLEWVGDSSR